jgi:predicted Zn-dependent peptidase
MGLLKAAPRLGARASEDVGVRAAGASLERDRRGAMLLRPARAAADRTSGGGYTRISSVPRRSSRHPADRLVTRRVGPGVRLHLLQTDRFTTSVCRVVLHRDLGPETTATAVLASVLRAASEAYPSRRALAERLAGLYGASLGLATERLGDRLLFSATLEWPTSGLPGSRGLLAEGLDLLGGVLARPKRGAGGALDAEITATERTNQARALQALRDDKGRYAARRALALACAGEPFARDPEGEAALLDAVTPAGLAEMHARLLAHAPTEIFLVGDLGLDAAERAVRRHLLWAGRAARPSILPSPVGVFRARARARRVVERDAVAQGKLVLVFRAPIGANHRLAPAAHTLAGVLGGGPFARLFKVVRETHGLCYYANAGWNDAKGLLVVQVGIDPKNEARARRMIVALAGEVGRGVLEPEALRGFREAVAHRVASLADNRGARIAFAHEALTLGTDPSPRRYLERLEAVRPADVRAMGAQLALDTVFFLGGGAGARTAAARVGEDA